jgi:transposase
MTPTAMPALFVGVDWATQKHDVCALRPDGKIVAERVFPHTGTGLVGLADWLVQTADASPGAIFVAIEVPHGPVVDTLLERGMRVHAINPKQLDRFRDRFTTAGAKDDRRDAHVLADSLRTDARAFRELQPDAATVIELREWSRMNDELKNERNGHANRLREQLRRFFPQMLDLGDVSEPWLLDLMGIIPTPADAQRRLHSAIARILRDNRIRRVKADQVLQKLRELPVTVAPGTVEAATAHIDLLRERLRMVGDQIKRCDRRLDELISSLSTPEPEAEVEGEPETESVPGPAGEQRDAMILQSLPGVGRIVLATLLAEASRPLRERDYHALRALAGVAPVTRRSGKRHVVVMRKACVTRLRNAIYNWARVASQCDPVWKSRYTEFRSRGHSHGRACRGIADRLLKIAITMLSNQTTYDRSLIHCAVAA